MRLSRAHTRAGCCTNYPQFGYAYAELYLAEPADGCRIALTRVGTRVVENLATLPGLDRSPSSLRYLQGLIDAAFLNLTPRTRSSIIYDERYAAFLEALPPLKAHLNGLIDAAPRPSTGGVRLV